MKWEKCRYYITEKRLAMKSVCLLAVCLIVATAQAQQLWITDPLEPIYPDSNATERFSNEYDLYFPSGTVGDVHVLLQVPPGETFTITAFQDSEALPVAYWSKLVDVPVEENTGLDSRTEAYQKNMNPYVIRRAPFRIYEVVMPLTSPQVTADNASYTALRLSIPAEKMKERGQWKISIVATGATWKQNGIFNAAVSPAQLPLLQDSKFFYTNWFNLSRMEAKHQVARWSAAWYAMLEKYAALMAQGRQNSVNIPGELIAVQEGKIVLEVEKMYKFIETFRKYGFTVFESPHLMYRGSNDDWNDPELKTVLTGKRYYTPEGQRDIDTIVTLIRNFTTRYRLTHNWLQHISDEPTAVQARCYRDVVARVKSVYPEIKVMDATNDRDSLVGAVDYWCPLINDFQENEKFFREREKEGERVLVYTCLVPGGAWLNRLLDQEKLRQVYFGWGAAHYNTMGFLHWGLNQYYADPWQQSVIRHPAPGAGPENKLPAGDTHIIYPGTEGPLSSVRFEAHRIGIEDYELLQVLKRKNPDLAATLIASVFTSYTHYERSVEKYREVRKQLLKAL